VFTCTLGTAWPAMSTDIAPDESWLQALRTGDPDKAWDLFLGRYRALIFAAIRHYAHDHDEVMDAFAEVCGGLRRDGLARVQRYWHRPTHTARFATWLMVVVHRLVIDWGRQHAFRKQVRYQAALSPLQRQIFECKFVQHRSHVETYELLRSTIDPSLSFRSFIRELRATYQAVEATGRNPLTRDITGPAPTFLAIEDVIERRSEDDDDPAVLLDRRLRITRALSALKPEERAAVVLFVVHEMPAAAIAQALGWPNAKAVYNRVYRALAVTRASLERQGIDREDL
jgi:RNA polymerase sigma factor (sigma-70 family)